MAGASLAWAHNAKPHLQFSSHDEVEDKILARANHLNLDEYGQKTVVGFHVRRDGTLQDVWIIEKSGSPAHDALAVNTVKTCAPFKPFPEGSAPVQKFALDINRNAHTWTYSNDRDSSDLNLNPFFEHLARNWHPPRTSDYQLVFMKFEVDPHGNIKSAELESPSNQFNRHFLDLGYSIESQTLAEMNACLHDLHIPEGLQIEEIRVNFLYEPRPHCSNMQHQLIGTHCGPGGGNSASGEIKFFDPH